MNGGVEETISIYRRSVVRTEDKVDLLAVKWKIFFDSRRFGHSKIYKFEDSEIKKFEDSKIQGSKDPKRPKVRKFEMFRNPKVQRLKDTKIQKHISSRYLKI